MCDLDTFKCERIHTTQVKENRCTTALKMTHKISYVNSPHAQHTGQYNLVT